MALPTVADAATAVDKTLYAFTGTDGASPGAALTEGPEGVVYGVAPSGGPGNAGVVFRLKRPAAPGEPWAETILYPFTGASDGGTPEGSLIRNADGTLFGTTAAGGDTTDCPATADTPAGCGVVFKLVPPSVSGNGWTEKVIYTFSGTDGAHPRAGLSLDGSGSLFGTTESGGSGTAGTVFRLRPPAYGIGTWVHDGLYDFTGGTDGGFPRAALHRDGEGLLFGTTVNGGDLTDCPATASHAAGCGVIFRLAPPAVSGNGWTQAVLHSFTGQADGAYPYAGLVRKASGELYGTTSAGGDTVACPATGGTAAGCGVVYALGKPDRFGVRALGVLYSFTGGADGATPLARLTKREDGGFYGTTFAGGNTGGACGTAGCGTVFVLSPPHRGVPKKGIVYSFTGGADGANPAAPVVRNSGGDLFGTVETGAAGSLGAAFKLRP